MGPGVALEHLHNFPLGSIKYSDSESDSDSENVDPTPTRRIYISSAVASDLSFKMDIDTT